MDLQNPQAGSVGRRDARIGGGGIAHRPHHVIRRVCDIGQHPMLQ